MPQESSTCYAFRAFRCSIALDCALTHQDFFLVLMCERGTVLTLEPDEEFW